MSVVVGMYRGGLIIAEAPTTVAPALAQAINDGIRFGAEVFNQASDARSLWETIESSFSGDGLDATKVIGSTAFGSAVTIALVESGAAAATIGAAAFAAGVVLSPAVVATAAVVAAAAAGYYAGEYYEYVFEELKKRGQIIGEMLPDFFDPIDPAANTSWVAARTFVERRDPLALDLDGDGIETVGVGATPVLFDHDGDGVRTGTGWVKSDDAFLALDRNGNGTIDNGGELFGVDTILANGQKAADGFAALADLDSNRDGVFNSADSHYANVRIWRDLNQDGISQANELSTLASAGIASIHLTSTAANTGLGNGNLLTAVGTYTKTNGETGSVGEFTTGSTGNLDLAQNPFYSDFTDPITLTDGAKTLPGMQGSGMVRDLQQAASLDGALVSDIAALAGTTRAQMMNALDGLLERWAATSTMPTSLQSAAANGFALTYLVPGMSVADYWAIRGLDGADASDGTSVMTGQRRHIDQPTTLSNTQIGEISRYVFVLFNGALNAGNDGCWRKAA